MVMDQGNFHLMDNDLKFTIIWELAYLPKSTEPQLNRCVDFISGRRLKIVNILKAIKITIPLPYYTSL